MFHFFAGLFGLIGLVVTAGAAIFAFGAAREYVRTRLRYVDAVRRPLAPWVVWLVGTVVLTPVVAILPLVHFATAVIVGGAAALGTSSGVKALQRGD